MSIPYMGGKRKLSKRILGVIKQSHPDAKTLYDLFGGGGAISTEALNHFENVHYNEIDSGVVKLLERIQQGGIVDEPDFYKWVSREEFHERKHEDSWQGGLIKTCWSFGSNVKDYLYGKPIEEIKRLLHDLIVYKIPTDLFTPSNEALNIVGVQARRLAVMREYKSFNGRFQMQHLGGLNHIERLQHLEGLHISNKSALDFNEFNDDSVVYLDPPYFGTRTYQNELCHDSFKKWVLSLKVPVYVSSYDIDWLECVAEFNHISTLSATNNSKRVIERLYWNGVS